MRSIATQTESDLGGRWSVLVRQRRDHVVLDGLLQELVEGSLGEQPEVLRRIYRLVFPHAFAEEAVLWPALRKVLPDGDELTLTVEEEHQQVNELVTRLETTPLADPGRGELVARVVELLRDDVRDEEDTLLPRLQDAVSGKELCRLGLVWEAVRRTAPTRPHPVVSRRPPGNVLSALPLSVLDRSRDALERAESRSGGTRPVLRRASGALAGAAGRVERLGVLRRGERSETQSSR